jgi:hypothetical protein
MLAELAGRATTHIFKDEPHREMTGLKRAWIRFLRRYPGYYRSLYATYRQPANDRLVQIHLEPTNGCNLKCVTCNNDHTQRDKGMMDMELARKIIDEAWDEMGASGKLGLFIRGESVMHAKLPDMIRYAQDKGFTKILLSTNIMLLNPERARRILEAGISELRLSVDAVDAETFETTRARARFDVIVNNLEELNRLRTELGSKCSFRLHASLHRKSFEKIPEFIRRWQHMIQLFRFTVAVNQGGLFPQSVARTFSDMEFATSTAYQVPCRILYDYVGVTWNGKLTSCCVDYREQFVVGDIQDGLKNGFIGEKAKAIRDSHLQGDFGKLCGQCGFNNALVDWFEDEVNDYVCDHMQDMQDPAKDGAFVAALNDMITKFDRIAATPPAKKTFFG